MLDFLKKIFREEKKELAYEWSEAPKRLRDLKEEELVKADEESEKLMHKSEQVLDRLSESLDEVKGYEDHQGIEAVEDVANNFYNSRKRLINNLELSDNPVQHKNDLEEFIEEFENVSRKEEAVMKRVRNEADSLFKSIKEFHEHLEEFNNFLQDDYKIVTSIESLEKQVNEIKQVEDKKERLIKEKNNINIEELKKEVSGLENQIEQLEDSDERQRKIKIEDELESLQKDRDKIESELKRQLSKVERPVKKLVYNIESGNTEYNGSIQELKNIRDQQLEELENVDLFEAYELAESEDFIDDSQAEKMRVVAEELEDFIERKKRIAKLGEEIQEKKAELKGLEVDDDRRKIVNKLSSKKEKIREEKIGEENLQEDIEGLKKKKSDLINQVETDINNLTRHKIEIKEE